MEVTEPPVPWGDDEPMGRWRSGADRLLPMPAPPPLQARRPPSRRRSRPARRWLRTLSKVAVALSVLIFALTGVGYGAYRYYDAKLSVVAIHPHGVRRPAPPPDAAQNFLLVGSDTRDFAGGAQFQAPPGSADYVTGQRSDTVLLVHLPPGQARATIVSFPRDSYVEIPAYVDAKGVPRPAHMAKLNEAYADGGAPLLVQLIENLSGLPIDHYVQVDFAGFEKMVDAVGGITLCVGTTRHDTDSGDFLTAGVHPNVRGAAALAFARDRKGLTYGDIDRIKDQQYFLSQMLKKTLSAGTLANPIALNRFLTALTSSVTVDNGFGFSQMQTLATRLRHLDPAHVLFTTIPFSTEDGWRTFEGYRQSVVLLDPAADAELFAGLRADTTAAPPTHPPSPTAAPLLAPAQVTVSVENATGIAGLAHRVAGQLRDVGFQIGDIGTVATGSRTELRYSPDRADSARTVAAAVPDAVLVPDVSGSSGVLQLIVGSSGLAVQAPGAAAASPAPSPTTSPAAPPVSAAAVTCAP
jgi:LCP family protein required for cell wall assembly